MGRTTTGLIKSLEATVATPKRRLVKFGAADGTGVPATDGASYIRGVSADIDTAPGERISVQMSGNIADVDYGAVVTRGQPLTADAQGRAVPAAVGDYHVGFAEVSGVLGDVGSVDIAPGQRAA
jgi:hypothetical protein